MDGNIKKYIRIGIISSVDAGRGTARVIWHDEDNKVSADLAVCQSRNAADCKIYKMYNPGEQVIALFPGNSYSDGYIIGAVPSNDDPPLFASADKMGLKFGNIEITMDKSSGNIDINTPGDVKVNGKKIND